MTPVEQMLAAQKANLETLFTLTHKAFEGVEKLVELNLQTARNTLSDSTENARAAMSAKDAVELMKLQASLLQPAAEKVAAYSRSMYDIATSTGAEVGRVAQETAAEAQAKLMNAVDAAAKNAPPGSEKAVAMVKQSIAAAGTAYDGMQRAVKQASDTAESNMQSMSSGMRQGQ